MTLSKKFLLYKTAFLIFFTSVNISHAQSFWQFATAYGDKSYHTRIAKEFIHDVEACTNQQLRISLHSGGKEIPAVKIKNSVETARIQIGEFYSSRHAIDDPIFGFDSLPYVATDFTNSERLLQAVMPSLNKSLNDHDLRYLYSVPWPAQGLYARQKISSVDQLREKTILGLDETSRLLAQKLEMLTPDIPSEKLLHFIAAGKVDFLITSAKSAQTLPLDRYYTHYLPLNFAIPRNIVVINNDSYNRLNKIEKSCVDQAAFNASVLGRSIARKEISDAQLKLANTKMQIQPISQELKNEFEEITQQISYEWMKKMGQDGQQILSDYEKLKSQKGTAFFMHPKFNVHDNYDEISTSSIKNN